jgi:tetratricopeptide (TPR) repeat protein
LRGDAFMRIPARVKEALPEFAYALAQAEAVDPPDRHRLLAEAFKEQGYYHRNIGQWDEANLSYQHARDAMSALPPAMRSAKDREEVASIHTNWAYVKGLTGSYRDGLELVESAINVRHALRNPENEGLSWSVCGEVYRYARRFQRAWEAYSSAEELLLERRNWGRLGFVYQEQAICLFQADVDGIKLSEEPMGDAKARITRALDICVTHAVRGYPSALNRAGRIFGHDDPGEGLEYLGQGITEARRLSDGWFWFANVIEYAELLYRMWTGDGSPQIRAQLDDFADEVQLLDEEYRFPDLSGRWSLLQAHLAFSDYEENDDLTRLETALDCYQTGFANIAMRHVGSSGAASVRREFGAFRDNFKRLPAHIQEEWQARLRSAWTPLTEGSTRLLARLEELY